MGIPSKNTTHRSYLFLLIPMACLSCGSNKRVAGIYQSNFADLGFFVTRLQLGTDSSVGYRHSGDLIFDTASGIYHVRAGKVYVKFTKLGSDNFGPSHVPVLQTRRNRALPFEYDYQYIIGRQKLFRTNIETGKIVRRGRGYFKRKKYLLFGSHYYNRRLYLRK